MANSVRPTMKDIHLPPAWCSGICRNAMNEICVEHCAVRRDCSAFEPKRDLKLSDMPRFPLKESRKMTRDEKFTSVTVYLAKIVDQLNGIDDDQNLFMPQPTPYLTNLSRRKVVANAISAIQSSQSDAQSEETKGAAHQTGEPGTLLPNPALIESKEG